MPNNGFILAMHMSDCDLDGPLKNVTSPAVVWREGTFTVVREPAEGEQTYDIGFERVNHEIELPVLDIDLVDGVNVEPTSSILSPEVGTQIIPKNSSTL
jgi:hypothetical protein